MKRRLSLISNIFIAVMVPAAWSIMVFHLFGDGVLTTSGLGSLRYFTVLSNLLAGAASLCYAVGLLRKTGISRWMTALKYVATVAVTLTFLTVIFFLGPLFGFAFMYQGANLWFHLVIPAVSVLEFCLLDHEHPLPFFYTLLAVLPMAVYGIFYLGNNLINGVGAGETTNDWYGFLLWGLPVGLIIFAALILVTWGAAVLIRALNKKCG